MLCIAVIFHPRNIPGTVFVPLIKFGAMSLEFSFDHIMYKQIDGIAMGSPLRPVMAHIFVGFYEQLLFSSANKWNCYVCYVDGTFCVFNSVFNRSILCRFGRITCGSLFHLWKGERLPFLDVFVQRQTSKIVTSVYKKTMFTGLHIHWDSFCPGRHKINLVKILFHRNLLISSIQKLERKLEFASKIFSGNDYPLELVQSSINAKIAHFFKLNLFGFENVPVYLRLLWISETRARFVRKSPPVLDNVIFWIFRKLWFLLNLWSNPSIKRTDLTLKLIR